MTTTTPTSFITRRASITAGALFLIAAYGVTAAFGEAEPTSGAAPSPVTTLTGQAHVVDGDTIDLNGQRIRLEGIDAPETAQTCMRASGANWACGRAAAKALQAMVAGLDVSCDSRGHDKYGRVLGICYAEGRDINAAMVKAGLAWAFVKYSKTYVMEEKAAQTAKAGVWQGPAQAPWDFRHHGWQVAEAVAPRGCAIKGNVSSKGRIYHMPWSPWYARVTIDATRGEQWFCSEDEAHAAGWRPALNY